MKLQQTLTVRSEAAMAQELPKGRCCACGLPQSEKAYLKPGYLGVLRHVCPAHRVSHGDGREPPPSRVRRLRDGFAIMRQSGDMD